jgi:hypothetical protein
MISRVYCFFVRALKFLVFNLHVIVFLILGYLVIFLLSLLCKWFTDFDTYFSGTRKILFSISLTVLILEFLKSERDRRRSLKSQFSLFYLVSLEFDELLRGLEFAFEDKIYSDDFYKMQVNNPIYSEGFF